jgi:hypothetical protein
MHRRARFTSIVEQILNTGLSSQMTAKAGFQRCGAMDGYRQTNAVAVLAVNMVAAVDPEQPPTPLHG